MILPQTGQRVGTGWAHMNQGYHQQVGAHVHTAAAAAAATTLSLPAVAAGVAAVDKRAQMRANNGKSGHGQVKTSVRTNELRERWAHTMPDNSGIGSTGWTKQQWQQLRPHHPVVNIPIYSPFSYLIKSLLLF